MSSPAIDCYKILDLSPDARFEVIQAAYRARCNEPGLGDGNSCFEGRMASVNEAYRILSDPKLRADYDARLVAQVVAESPDGADGADATIFKCAYCGTVNRVQLRARGARCGHCRSLLFPGE